MSKRKEIVSRGTCAGHWCDACAICTGGRCCRRDNPEYRLPDEGDWDGPIHGALGTLERSETGVVCHACGDEFRALSCHIWSRHDLTGREYKAIFGLKLTQPLCSLESEERWRGAAAGRPSGVEAMRSALDRWRETMTPEQWSARSKECRRLSTQERRELGLRVEKPCMVCGQEIRDAELRRKMRKTCSRICAAELRRRSAQASRLVRNASPRRYEDWPDPSSVCLRGHRRDGNTVTYMNKGRADRRCAVCHREQALRRYHEKKRRSREASA